MPGLRRADVLAGRTPERARAAFGAMVLRAVRAAGPGPMAGRDLPTSAVRTKRTGETLAGQRARPVGLQA